MLSEAEYDLIEKSELIMIPEKDNLGCRRALLAWVFYTLTFAVFTGWVMLILNIDVLLYQNDLIEGNSLFDEVNDDVKDFY